MPKYNTYDGKIKLNVGDVVKIMADNYTYRHYRKHAHIAIIPLPIGEKCIVAMAARGALHVVVMDIGAHAYTINTRDLSFVGTSAELNGRRWGKRTIQTFHRDRDEAQAK